MTGSATPPPQADDEVERRLAALKAGADPGRLGDETHTCAAALREHVVRAKGIGSADVDTGASNTQRETLEHALFVRPSRDQMEGMHASALTDTIHPANALLETHRIPG